MAKKSMESLRSRKERREYSVSKPKNDAKYKIIQNVSHDTKYFTTVEEASLEILPKSDPVYIPLHEFNRYIRPSKVLNLGIIVEIDEDGYKVEKDNPNAVFDVEIEAMLSKSLDEIKKWLNTITSPFVMSRVVSFASKPNIESGIAAAAKSRYEDLAFPKGEPTLDIDQFGRSRRAE